MAAGQGIDFGAHLQGFLLRKYVDLIRNASRTREQRLESQMEFEYFLHGLGPRVLPELEKAIHLEIGQVKGIEVVEWFIDFVTSQDKEWLSRLDTKTIARHWPTAATARSRRRLIELIAKGEWTQTEGRGAPVSQIVTLFRAEQPDPDPKVLTERGSEIVRTLARLAELARPTEAMYAETLSLYALRILSFCFQKPGARLTVEEAESVMGVFENLTKDQYSLFLDRLLRTG